MSSVNARETFKAEYRSARVYLQALRAQGIFVIPYRSAAYDSLTLRESCPEGAEAFWPKTPARGERRQANLPR